MTLRSERRGDERTSRRRIATARRAAGGLLLAGCVAIAGCTLGPPPMEPLTAAKLEDARSRWAAHGSDAYRLVVRVRPPHAAPAVYEVRVAGGELVEVARDGAVLAPEELPGHDYSVAGIFEFLREDLRWTAVEPVGDVPAVDLRAYFDPETGRLVRYRRTVGTSRRRVLLVEVLDYEPGAAVQLSAHAGADDARVTP